MPRHVQPSRLKSKPTRKLAQRKLLERRPFVKAELTQKPLPQSLQLQLLRRQQARRAKTTPRHDCRSVLQVVVNRILPRSQVMPVRITHSSAVFIIELTTAFVALREVAEYLAGQTLSVDVETVTFAQHFPRQGLRSPHV